MTRVFTEEHKARISASLTGKHALEETRQKMSESALTRLPMSNETKRRMSEARRGVNNPRFKGEYTSNGYVYLWTPQGRRKRADLIMERMLGRPLLPKEQVNHKNLIRDDDTPENLELFANQSAHIIFHNRQGDIGTKVRDIKGKFAKEVMRMK